MGAGGRGKGAVEASRRRASGARGLKVRHAEGVYRVCEACEGCSGGGFPIGKSLLEVRFFKIFAPAARHSMHK